MQKTKSQIKKQEFHEKYAGLTGLRGFFDKKVLNCANLSRMDKINTMDRVNPARLIARFRPKSPFVRKAFCAGKYCRMLWNCLSGYAKMVLLSDYPQNQKMSMQQRRMRVTQRDHTQRVLSERLANNKKNESTP